MHISRYVLYIWHTSCMECLTQASKPNLMCRLLMFWVLQSRSKRPYTKGKMVLILLVELHTLQSWWALSPSQRAGFSLPVTPSIQPEKRTPNLSVIKSWKFQFMLQCIHVNFIYITEQYSYYHVTSAFSSTFSNCQSICADDFLCMIVDVSCIPATTSLGISILFLNRNPQMKLKYL